MITLKNDYHGTEVRLRVGSDGRLTERQVKRVRKVLCGVDGCTCGDNLGRRGPQDDRVDEVEPGVYVAMVDRRSPEEKFFADVGARHNMITIHLRWSRGGTVTARLWHADGHIMGRASGYGYDVAGSAMGQAVSKLFPDDFRSLAKASTEETRKHRHYGLLSFEDGGWAIDGACGTVERLVRAIG